MVLLGTIPGWLTLVAVVALAISVARGSGGQALGIERAANQTLQEALASSRARVAELERTRTLEPLLVSIAEGFATHEAHAHERHVEAQRRADERHDAELSALKTIATNGRRAA